MLCCVYRAWGPPLALKCDNLPRQSKLTVLLHDSEELDNDLGAWADQDLTLAALLGVVDGIEAVVEHGSLDHFGGID